MKSLEWKILQLLVLNAKNRVLALLLPCFKVKGQLIHLPISLKRDRQEYCQYVHDEFYHNYIDSLK